MRHCEMCPLALRAVCTFHGCYEGRVALLTELRRELSRGVPEVKVKPRRRGELARGVKEYADG